MARASFLNKMMVNPNEQCDMCRQANVDNNNDNDGDDDDDDNGEKCFISMRHRLTHELVNLIVDYHEKLYLDKDNHEMMQRRLIYENQVQVNLFLLF
jgi:hypothetical protein